MLLVSKEIETERLKTCLACPLVVLNDKRADAHGSAWQKLRAMIENIREIECSVCGCPTKLRAKQAIVGCPKRKWRR